MASLSFTTGDFGSLCARLTGARWRLVTPPQHLWYFTPKSLGHMSRSLGLTLVACDHPWKLEQIPVDFTHSLHA